MADFLNNAKNFARDLAKDAVHFPRTAASWPAFKSAAVALYKETKSDLFFFRRDSLNPILAEAAGKIDAALKQDNTPEKADTLLALKEDIKEGPLNTIGVAQSEKGMWTTGLLFAGIFISAAITVNAIPYVMVAAVAVATKFMYNSKTTQIRDAQMSDKIDRAILEMAATDTHSVFSSPKFQKALVDKGVLKKVFTGANWGHWKDADYERFVAGAVQKAATPEPPAATPSA